jgi:vitamin B12 transporter
MARSGKFALLALLLSTTTTLAQVRELPQIVIYASQYPLESSRVGASATVLTGEQLRADGIETVAEALRNVPGVAIDSAGGRGTFTQVRIRGAEANQVLVLIDGIEVNGLADPLFDFADFPVDEVERIEIIRGPQSGIYGSNAHAGVISIVTRSGKGLARPRLDAKVEAGSRRSLAGSLNVRGAQGPFYGSVTITDYATRGYNISRFGFEPDGSRATTFTVKAGVDITPNFNVEAVVRATDRWAATDAQDFNCVFDPITFTCPPVNPATYGLIVDSIGFTAYQGLASRVGATLKLFDGRWIQSANAKLFDEHLRSLDAFLGPFATDGTRVAFDYKSTFLFDSNLAGGERHTVTVLTDHRREDFTQLGVPTPYHKERTGLAGEYVLDLATLTTLSGALRHDWNEGFADVLTWRVALSQRFPSTNTRFHSSAGKGITDPTVFELFGSPFNLPNPSLVPEQSIGWDAGIEQRLFDGRVIADVTYFSSDFTNKIELTFDPVGGGFVYVNGTGIARRHGVEVAITARLLEWLTLQGTYTYTHARDSTGAIEVRRPPHSGSLEAAARFAEKRGKAVLGVVFNGSRKDFYFGPVGTTLVDLPGATVVRAYLSYDITPLATLFVRAENLLNAHYEEILSYRAAPFAAYAGLKIKLGD